MRGLGYWREALCSSRGGVENSPCPCAVANGARGAKASERVLTAVALDLWTNNQYNDRWGVWPPPRSLSFTLAWVTGSCRYTFNTDTN